MRIVFNWGKSYLARNNKQTNLKDFFEETGISPFITIFSFETIQASADFMECELGAGYFTQADMINYIKANRNPSDNRTASWFDVKAGDFQMEKLLIRNVSFFANHILKLKFRMQGIVFFEFSQRPDGKLCDFEYYCKIRKAMDIKKNNTGVIENRQVGFRTFYYKWDIDAGINIVSDIEIDVKYMFHVDCRMLKCSPGNFEGAINEDDIYLHSSVEFEYIEKPRKQ